MKRRVLLIVQDRPIPFDRRVAGVPGARFGGLLVSAGYWFAVVCPTGSGDPGHEHRTHWAAGHVISTNDSYREIAMRPRVGQDKGQRARGDPIRRAILTGAPMPIPVGSLVATARATIAVGENLLSGSSERV